VVKRVEVEVGVGEGVVLGDNMYVNMPGHMSLDILRHMGWLLACILRKNREISVIFMAS
jgi:hypothetical protein